MRQYRTFCVCGLVIFAFLATIVRRFGVIGPVEYAITVIVAIAITIVIMIIIGNILKRRD